MAYAVENRDLFIDYSRSPALASLRSFEIDLIADLDGLSRLRSEWDEMAPAAQVEPWKSYNWMESAAIAFSEFQEKRILTIRKNGRLMAIAPMVVKRSEQMLRPLGLHFLGGEELKEPNSLIYRDPQSLDLLMDVLASEPVLPIRMSRIPNTNGMLSLLKRKFEGNRWVTWFTRMPYPYIELSSNKMKRSLCTDLKRAQRKAEGCGQVRFEMKSESSQERLSEDLKKAFKIEASGWKGQNHSAILYQKSRKKFFEHYANSSRTEGALRLSFLNINDESFAVQYAVESMNNYWLMNIGYNETVRWCSPGNLLLEHSLKAAQERGVVRYNLLGKIEPWTLRWTQAAQDCIVFAAYRPNLLGLKTMFSDAWYLICRPLSNRKKKSAKIICKKKLTQTQPVCRCHITRK